MRIACLKFGETKALEEIVIRSRVHSTQQAQPLKRAAMPDDFFSPLHALNFSLYEHICLRDRRVAAITDI